MSISAKQWVIAPPLSAAALRNFRGYDRVMAQVLYNRGFSSAQEAKTFLSDNGANNPLHLKAPDTAQGPQRPLEMKDVRKAAERIIRAIQTGESIVIYGDFDADGVTSTVLLVEVLQALGANVAPYIPHRVDEGYGLNSAALRKLAADGVALVVTVDCGIRSVQEVADGIAAGLDIIVTDHHSLGPELPDAYAVVNPKQLDCPYPEKELAGVGVAYKLAGALLQLWFEPRLSDEGVRQQIRELLDQAVGLVAIGTVADIMPLNRPENHGLVRRGLEVLNQATRPGIKALLEVCGIEPGQVTAMSIGFALGPRINAAGRLGSAMTAFDLLTAPTEQAAAVFAQELQALNEERQQLTRAALAATQEAILRTGKDDQALIFAEQADIRPGIVGLVAGRLCEEYFRPTVVMAIEGDEGRASCRSIPQFDITQALDQCADLLLRHGGHAQAAGFSVALENVPPLRERLTQIAESTLAGQTLLPLLEIDVEVDLNQLSEKMVDSFAILEPTGNLNAVPLLMSRNVYVKESRYVGKEHRHIKLNIARTGLPDIEAVGFGLGAWQAHFPAHVDIAYYLEINVWNGRSTLQLNLQDIRPASGVETDA